MPFVEPELALLRVPRLAEFATSARPAWLWSTDGSWILWANAVGAALFGAGNVGACRSRRFASDDPTALQIVRLAGTLPSGTQQRLERLRGFGSRFGRALVCGCSQIPLPDGNAAVLVVAAEPAGPALSLDERVKRLFADVSGAHAVFTPDGKLVYATAAALQQLAGATTVDALGIEPLARAALEQGSAGGPARAGQNTVEITAQRLGAGDARVIAVTLPSNHQTNLDQAASPNAEAATEPPGGAPIQPAALATPETDGAQAAIIERRHPLRFVWQMDADGRFMIGSDEFIELVGPRTTAACGRHWNDIAAELKLDPDSRVARAVATHETWSGIEISWPVDEPNQRLQVELSGLPVFDRDRVFHGYRGFGVCRDVARINQLLRARQGRPLGFIPPTPPTGHEGPADEAHNPAAAEPAAEAISAPVVGANAGSSSASTATAPMAGPADPAVEPTMASAKVVPFRSGHAPETKTPSLSPVERNAFRELAQELTARLRGNYEEAAVAESIIDPIGSAERGTAAAFATEIPQPLEPEPAGVALASADPVIAVAADIPPLAAETSPTPPEPTPERVLLDHLPAGLLVHRDNSLLYANHRFFEMSGYESLEALTAAGGLTGQLLEPNAAALAESGAAQKLSMRTRRGEIFAAEVRSLTIPWHDGPATALVVTGAQDAERLSGAELALKNAELENRELKAGIDRTAKRELQRAAAFKADFLAKVKSRNPHAAQCHRRLC